MGRDVNDFTLASKGHCFLCLNKICTTCRHGQESSPVHTSKFYSLHYLSRYLKMDMRKVFHDSEQIPPQLLAKVKGSRLKVELCDKCVCLIERFSENYRRIERAEIELGSCLRLILAKFLDENETGNIEYSRKATDKPAPVPVMLGSGGELEVLTVLREEAFQKSHIKLEAAVPRVKFCNLTRNQIKGEQLKYKTDLNSTKHQEKIFLPGSTPHSPILQVEPLVVSDSKPKLETVEASTISDNANGNCHSNDFNPNKEVMCDTPSDTSTSGETSLEAKENSVSVNGPENKSIPSLVPKFPRAPKIDVETPDASINPETGKYKCVTCPMEFSTNCGFKLHYKSIHLKIRIKCVTCGQQFSQRGHFQRHQKIAHVGVRHACQVCSKSFTRADDVKFHQRTADCGKKLGLKLVPKHTCHICGKILAHKGCLPSHLKRVHSK